MKPFPSSAMATISSSSAEWPRRISPPSRSVAGGSSATAPSRCAASGSSPRSRAPASAQQRRRARLEQVGEPGQREQRAAQRAEVARGPLPQHEPREEPLQVRHRPQRLGEVLAHHRRAHQLLHRVEPRADAREVGERVAEPLGEPRGRRAR